MAEIQHAVAEHECVLAVGNQTKAPMSCCPDATLISFSKYEGVTEYEPSEFTFTAKAGTRLTEVTRLLSQHGQYLPFDPPLSDAGATLGGTVAANMSGPGRFRYGGVRDFVLGIEFISGDGQIIRAGGKVVKNAAGFDIPKLLVGSMGRLGVMTELTFKVFPQPESSLSLEINTPDHASAIARISELARSPWELEAIDYRPKQGIVLAKIAGPVDANETTAGQIENLWPGQVMRQSDVCWHNLESDTHAIKVPTSHQQFMRLQSRCDQLDVESYLSVAGAVTWLHPSSQTQVDEWSKFLDGEDLRGLVVTGPSPTTWIGSQPNHDMASRIKHAIDPIGKFPA